MKITKWKDRRSGRKNIVSKREKKRKKEKKETNAILRMHRRGPRDIALIMSHARGETRYR